MADVCRFLAVVAVTGVVLVGLDLLWLGVVARPFYDAALGALRRPEIVALAAALFYVCYVGAVVSLASLPASETASALYRGAVLGAVAYGTYQLTNWAVIADWPVQLVWVDIGWGVLLTALAAAAGHRLARLVGAPCGEAWEGFVIQLEAGENFGRVWRRRLASFSMFLAVTIVAWTTAPLVVPVLAIADLATPSRRKMARPRAASFFTWYLGMEVFALAGALFIWVTTANARLGGRATYLAAHVLLQRIWSRGLFGGALWFFSIRLRVENQDLARTGPFVLLVRHTSTADTLLAAHVIANPFHVHLRYVLKRELTWDPCLDVVARRLPNAFIKREGDGGAVERIAGLTRTMGDNEAVLIYPEGTRFSAARRQKAIARLRERGQSSLADKAEAMQHVLAPRIGGVLAALDAAPNTDVVILAHVGLEGARSFDAFWNGGLVGADLRARIWRIDAAAIPESGRESWLFDKWLEVDRWIDGVRAPS